MAVHMQDLSAYIHEMRVRYQETDQMGVVYHSNYLNWFEVARTEMIRDAGLPYREIEQRGLLLPVVDAQIKFIKPAQYDDIVRIYAKVTDYSHIRLSFAYSIYRWGQLGEVWNEEQADLLVTGSTQHVWIDRNWKPVRIDKAAQDVYVKLQQLKGFAEK